MLNAFVGWYQEKQAGDIVEQLKAGIALKATVCSHSLCVTLPGLRFLLARSFVVGRSRKSRAARSSPVISPLSKMDRPSLLTGRQVHNSSGSELLTEGSSGRSLLSTVIKIARRLSQNQKSIGKTKVTQVHA